MPKIVHYEQGDSSDAIIAAYQQFGTTDTAAFLQAVEDQIVPRLSTSGSYAVTEALELSSWLGQFISHCIENGDIIRGVE